MSKFVYFNPNPSYKPFKNGKDKMWTIDDYNVRALCKVIGKDWDTSYDMLSLRAKEMRDVMTSKKVFKSIMEDTLKLGQSSFGKPKQDQKRPTVEEFCKDHQTGMYVLNLASKVVVIVDGQFYDTEDCSESSVYSWWYQEHK